MVENKRSRAHSIDFKTGSAVLIPALRSSGDWLEFASHVTCTRLCLYDEELRST